MPSAALHLIQDELSITSLDDQPQIKELLQQLLAYIAPSGDNVIAISESENAEEILLDFQLNGERYQLVRFQPPPAPLDTILSPREQQIAQLVAGGLPNKRIAAVLCISSWTVATHLRRIFAKLGVNTRAEMVAQVMRDSKLAFALDKQREAPRERSAKSGDRLQADYRSYADRGW